VEHGSSEFVENARAEHSFPFSKIVGIEKMAWSAVAWKILFCFEAEA